MGCYPLLQGIFPTQGLNPGLLHCRRILYHLRYQGSPDEARNTEVCVSLQTMIFFCIYPGDCSFLKDTDEKLPRKMHIGQRICEKWNFGFIFPGCHGQLCVPSTDVLAVSTCRQGSSLQAPCPECLLGLHRQGMTDGPYS